MKKYILISIFMFLTCQSIAQQDTTKRESTTVFFGGPSSDGSSSNRYKSNAIKLNISGLFSGLIGLYYERELGSTLTFEIGGGLTTRNYVFGIINDGLLAEDETEQTSPNFNGYYNDEYDEDYKYDRRKAKLGYYVAVMPRYYYTEDGFDGSYLGFNFQYRSYKMEAFGLDPADAQFGSFTFVDGAGNIDEFDKQLILALGWGNQYIGEKTVMDYNISIGVRKNNGERIDTGYFYNPSGFNTAAIGPIMRDISKTSFFFEIGFKLGMWWN